MINLDKRIEKIANGDLPPEELNIVLNDMLVSDNLYQRKIAEGASVMMRRKIANKKIAKEMLNSEVKSPRLYNKKKSDIIVKNSTSEQSKTINSIIRTYFTAKERQDFKDAGVKLRIEKLPADIAGQNKGRDVIIDPEIASRADGVTEDVVVHELIHAQNRLREEKKPNIYLRKESIIDGPEDIRNDTEIEESVTEAMTTARLQTYDATSKEPIPTDRRSLDRRYNSEIKSCWTGYERTPGTKKGAKGSCRKITKSYYSKSNPRLPKDGSLDGVLSRNPDPPAMNAGMPRDPDLLARLKRMQEAKLKQQWLDEAGPKHWESTKYQKKRIFGNKEFERFDGTGFRTSQSEATLRAQRLRDLGNSARVVKYATGYGVYVRRPETAMERQMAKRRIAQGIRRKSIYNERILNRG